VELGISRTYGWHAACFIRTRLERDALLRDQGTREEPEPDGEIGEWRAVNGVRRTPAPSGEPRGRFIVLEGIDGSGKTEQLRRLASWLRREGHEVVETQEPSDTEWGRLYRAWARGEHEASPETVLRYFIEDRREHVAGLIRPAVALGKIVVCDRYVASTLAYQSAQGISRQQLQCQLDAEGFPEPDLVLWLRLTVEEAMRRLGEDAVERFERRSFLEGVDAEYARLGLEEIDAAGDPEGVATRIRARVQLLLAGPPGPR
jgi:dTMP kinase